MGRLQPGFVLSGTPYRIIRHLATGGMGSVYEIEDDSVGRRYVLKTLHPEMIDRKDLALRMREEARALGRLDHPNIVSVVTAGTAADMPYYVMERLVGQNLRNVLEARGGGLGKPHAYRIAIDVLDALQHAHESGMIHRDVKPENIFLHRGKGGTETKLLDFGIVRLLDKHASLTRGKFIGTLRYASPEQVKGRTLAPATDIYSVALVIYEMLTGSGPFDAEGDAYAIGAAHVGKPAPSLGGLVPPEVDAILLQALAKEPDERPKSCALIANALRKALRIEEEKPNATTDLELLSTRHPVDGDVAGETVPPTVTSTPTAASPSNALTAPSGLGSTTRIEASGMVLSATIVAPLMSPVPPPVPGGIDRSAPTRITPPSSGRVPLPVNDTRLEGITLSPNTVPLPIRSSRNEPTVRAARPIRRTDPALLAVIVAATLAAMMIAGALVFVRRGRVAGPSGTSENAWSATATH